MKKLFCLFTAILVLTTFFACSDEEDVSSVPAPTPEASIVSVPPSPSPEPEVFENINPLTGLADLREEAIGKRPVAVMVNNVIDSLPQYGIYEADLIFEIPVEGDITRLMTMYADYGEVPQVCSVRSSRYYYPILSVGFDAFYIHWGQDETIATEVLNSLAIDRYDGMSDTRLFKRDDDRYNAGYNLEHTGYFDGPEFPAVLEEDEMRTELLPEKADGFFKFNQDTTKPDGDECAEITVDFGGYYNSQFIYDEEKDTYAKLYSGEPHMDQRADKQLEFSNVFALETDISVRDDVGRKNVNTTGGEGYIGYYFSNGASQKITWSKDSEYDNLSFYDMDGEPLSINTGKIYIAFTWHDSVYYS